MTMTDEPGASESFQGRDAFGQCLRSQAAMAAALPAAPIPRELVWADEDFRDWPLDDAELIDSLTRFLRVPGRRLRLIAQRWDGADARHPRLARWRRDWSHAVEAFGGVEPLGLRPLALGPHSVIEVADTVYWRGQCRRDAPSRAVANAQLTQWIASCEAGWPVTTLGL